MRTDNLCNELLRALNYDDDAREVWEKLKPKQQREYAAYVEEVATTAAQKKRALELMWKLNPASAPAKPSSKKSKGTPADFQARIDNSSTARRAWAALTKAEKQAHIDHVEAAKTPVSRHGRMRKIIHGLIQPLVPKNFQER